MIRVIILILFVCLSAKANAQVEKTSELFITLKQNDSIIFDEGFNNCDHQATASLLKDNVKFYHDTGGVTTTAKQLLEDIANNICSGEQKMRRKLIESSLEVFALYDNGKLYGAIQNGIHEFYVTPPAEEEFLAGAAKFSHVWELTNEGWKLATVLSYDHNPASDDE